MTKQEKIQWLLEPLIQEYGKRAVQKALNDVVEIFDDNIAKEKKDG